MEYTEAQIKERLTRTADSWIIEAMNQEKQGKYGELAFAKASGMMIAMGIVYGDWVFEYVDNSDAYKKYMQNHNGWGERIS